MMLNLINVETELLVILVVLLQYLQCQTQIERLAVT